MEKNTFSWVDLPVSDLDRAISFYNAILQQEIMKVSEHGMEFGLLPHTENNVSGCLCVMPDRKPSQDGPLVYLNVEGHLQKATDAAAKNGGKILTHAEKIGPYGYRSIVLDTEGNAVGLYSKEMA